MRVKKFEAKTMKDALRMVKNELGPDAVILAARDNRKSFGLAGEGSVEVTAAVSENTLHKKKFVESRMRESDRDLFQNTSARGQKQIIERMTSRRLQQAEDQRDERKETRARQIASANTAPREITRTSYIDIPDEVQQPQSRQRSNQIPARSVQIDPRAQQMNAMMEADGGGAPEPTNENARARIRSAVREAWKAGLTTTEEVKPRQTSLQNRIAAVNSQGVMPNRAAQAAAPVPVQAPVQAQAQENDEEKEYEIINLKHEISRLQKVVENFQVVPQTFQMTAHPGAEFGISYDLSFMFQKLVEAGISTENIVEILSTAQKEMDGQSMKKRPLVDAFVARWFLNRVQLTQQPFAARMHCFVGGSGSGKTSTLVKMASQLVVKEKKRVAVLTTDAVKVGAADQLKTYCQILNVPFAIIRNQREWDWVLSQLGNVDHILVDFPGFNLTGLEEMQYLRTLMPPEAAQATFHLVVSAATKDSDATELARRYKVANFNDLIFTNLDQSVQHGVIYNVQKKTGKPLHSFGTGGRLPEDFEVASKERVLDLIFRLTRIRK